MDKRKDTYVHYVLGFVLKMVWLLLLDLLPANHIFQNHDHTLYLTVSEIIKPSLKSIGQFPNLIIRAIYVGRMEPNNRKPSRF